jgi:hypothetical protein
VHVPPAVIHNECNNTSVEPQSWQHPASSIQSFTKTSEVSKIGSDEREQQRSGGFAALNASTRTGNQEKQ